MEHERDYMHSVDVGGLDRVAELTQISSSRLVSTSTIHQPTPIHLQTCKSSGEKNIHVKVRACHKTPATQSNTKTWWICFYFFLMSMKSILFPNVYSMSRVTHAIALVGQSYGTQGVYFSLVLPVIVVERASKGQLF